MKHLLTVFNFELNNYLENKTYIITTALIAVLSLALTFLPHFVDLGLSDNTQEETSQTEEAENNDQDGEDISIDYYYVIYDKTGAFVSEENSIDALNQSFAAEGIEWKAADSEEDVKKEVEEENADAGFIINSLTSYDYFVYNKDLFDYNETLIEQMLTSAYQQQYCIEHDLDPQEIISLLNVEIEGNETVIGKDMGKSYGSCYALVIIVFMLIIFYGTMIATSVTSEKSNRSIELLVTSTKASNLLFGKVLSGAVASCLQVVVILAAVLGGYKLNADVWGHALDSLLQIKPEVLISFAMFGITGFVFYAFIYGAVGALVSKTEDLNKSASGVQMVIMIVYFVVLFQMHNVDGITMKVASFLPVSSYSAMFIRVAMGEVALWEIIVSYVILVASTIGMGFIGAKIYRMGTLRYGNPIKISAALKSLKRNEE